MHVCAMAVFLNKYFLNFSQNRVFFKQMAVARSIFILDGWVQLFWAAFDMPIRVVPLKVTIGYKK